ncbi:hypothetical protein ABPG74_021781 [Tetrahymena malaccensis]
MKIQQKQILQIIIHKIKLINYLINCWIVCLQNIFLKQDFIFAFIVFLSVIFVWFLSLFIFLFLKLTFVFHFIELINFYLLSINCFFHQKPALPTQNQSHLYYFIIIIIFCFALSFKAETLLKFLYQFYLFFLFLLYIYEIPIKNDAKYNKTKSFTILNIFKFFDFHIHFSSSSAKGKGKFQFSIMIIQCKMLGSLISHKYNSNQTQSAFSDINKVLRYTDSSTKQQFKLFQFKDTLQKIQANKYIFLLFNEVIYSKLINFTCQKFLILPFAQPGGIAIFDNSNQKK